MSVARRRLLMLFFASMAFALMIMVILYGLFIKDMDFSLGIKQPQSAPSPLDADQETTEPDADVSAPGDVTPSVTPSPEPTPEEAANPTPDTTTDETAPTPPVARPPVSTPPPVPGSTSDAGISPSSLHYVYLDGFASPQAAEAAVAQLQSRNITNRGYVRQHNGRIVVQFGVFGNKKSADALAGQLRQQSVPARVD